MANGNVGRLVEDPGRRRADARDALLVLAYYGLFMVYNSAVRENEALHWVTLVLLPFAYLYLVARGGNGAACARLWHRSRTVYS